MTPLMLLSDIIRDVMERYRLMYCSYPYPCGMEEACTHTRVFVRSYEVKEVGDKEVHIILPAIRGKRELAIRCWA